MTIIATFRVDGWPIVIGDVLLSGIPRPDVSIPSVHLANQIEFSSGRPSVSGICQKVELISEQLCVAWAGRAIEVYGLIQFLREGCGGKTLSWAEFRDLMGGFDLSALRETQFVAYFWAGNDFGSLDNVKSYELGDLEEVRLFGSGAGSWFRILEKVSTHITRGVVRGDKHLRGLLLALTLVGQAMGRQVFDGTGLTEGWGGAFEIAYFDGAGHFSKVQKIVYAFFHCVELENGGAKILLLRPFIYQYYEAKDLVVFVNPGDRSIDYRTYLIRPFGQRIDSKPTNAALASYDAAAVVAAFELVRKNGATHYGVRTWVGEFANSPVSIDDAADHSGLSVKEEFVREIAATFDFVPTSIEYSIAP